MLTVSTMHQNREVRLTLARVTNFRNVVDSEEIVIDPEVTCLVGKNESGKTALLSALYRVNPVHEATTFDAAKDYPRWKLSKDRREQLVDDAVPGSAVFAIEEADRAAVADAFGDGVLLSDTFGLQRTYAGKSAMPFVWIPPGQRKICSRPSRLLPAYKRSSKKTADGQCPLQGEETHQHGGRCVGCRASL